MTEISDSILTSTPQTLFCQYSLPEIQSISTKLTTISISKHEEIRTLVGSKYRDLLLTADEIKLMEELSVKQDRALYGLVFDKHTGVNGSNVEKFMKSGLRMGKSVDVNRVIKNSDFYIKLSKFLKISDDDDDDGSETGFEISEIEKRIDAIGPQSEWGMKTDVIMEKFKEIEVILINKVSKLMEVDELEKLQRFVVKKSDVFNFEKFNDVLYQKIYSLVSNDLLKKILEKFGCFKGKLEVDYIELVQSQLFNLTKQIEDLSNIDKSIALSLYSLSLDDTTYLKNIDYLSKGLIYHEYQLISDEFDNVAGVLGYLKLINKLKYDELQKQYDEIKGLFKQHGVSEKNQLLIKYLS